MSTLSQLLLEAADGTTVNWSKLPSKSYHSNTKESNRSRSAHDKSIYDEVQRWSGKNIHQPELCCAMGRAKVLASMNDVLSVILFEPFTIDTMLDGVDAIEVIPANKFNVRELHQHRNMQSRAKHVSYSDEDDDESVANESNFSSTVVASSSTSTSESSLTTNEYHSVVEEQVTLSHVKVKAVWPASPRDFCVASTVSVIERDASQKNKPKKVCIVSISSNHPRCPHPKDPYVRGKLGTGGWIVTSEYDPIHMMEITTITNVTQIDLCGSLPHWIVAETIKNNGEVCGKLKQIIEKRVHHQNWKASPFTLPGDIVECNLPAPQKKDTIVSVQSSSYSYSFSDSISTDNQIEVSSSLTLSVVEISSSRPAIENEEREAESMEKDLKIIETGLIKDTKLETIENDEIIDTIVVSSTQVTTLTNKTILIHGISKVVAESTYMEVYYDPKYNHSQQG